MRIQKPSKSPRLAAEYLATIKNLLSGLASLAAKRARSLPVDKARY